VNGVRSYFITITNSACALVSYLPISLTRWDNKPVEQFRRGRQRVARRGVAVDGKRRVAPRRDRNAVGAVEGGQIVGRLARPLGDALDALVVGAPRPGGAAPGGAAETAAPVLAALLVEAVRLTGGGADGLAENGDVAAAAGAVVAAGLDGAVLAVARGKGRGALPVRSQD
jgi:hypothetical protein